MAQSDGSIVLNTTLDNSGFEKNSKELVAAIKNLTDSINQMGKTLQSTFSGYTKAIQDAVTGTGNLQKAERSAAETASDLGSAAEEVKDGLETLRDQGDQPVIDFETPKKKATNLEKDIGGLIKKVKILTGLSDKHSKGELKNTSKLQQGYAEAQAELEQLQTRTENLGKAKLPTKDYQWLCDEIKKVDHQLEKYQDRQARLKSIGVSEETQGWKALQYDIDMAARNLADLNAEKAEMEADGSAWMAGSDTEPYQEAIDQLNVVSDQLDEIKAKNATAFEAPETQEVEKATTLTGLLKSGFDRVRSAASSALSGIAHKAVSVGTSLSNFIHSPVRSILSGLNSLAGKALIASGSLMKMAGSGIVAGLKKTATWAGNAAVQLARMAKNSIVSGIKKVGAAIKNMGRSTKSANRGFSGGLKAMLKYGLGVRSLFALINKLRAALVEGMQNLAQADPEFNSVMSNFIGSLKLLGNAFATAFAPIAEVVLPVLTQLINVLTEVISRIGMLFASLTGKKSFTKATAYQYDYAEATGDAKDATDDEKDSAKELQKTLAGFDDVEILKEDKADKSKTDKGTTNPSTFTEVPIDTDMSNLAQMIKDMWEKQDFSELGRIVGEKIRDALNNIDWAQIKETLRRIATCIATFLDGFLSTPGLFDAIGRTLAECLNSAFEFAEAFAQAFNWGDLGTAIKDGILGCLNNIDWELIKNTMFLYGQGIGLALSNAFDNPEIWTAIFTTLAEGLNSIVTFLNAFFEEVDWASLARNIGTGLNNGIAAIDWNGIAVMLCNFINGVFDAWYNFFTTVDWYRFGSLVGTSLSTVLNEVDWSTGGASVAATINALFYALNGFMESTDWAALGAAIIDIIAGFFGELDWGAQGKLLSNAWVSLFDFLSGAIDEVDWEKLPEDICTSIGEFLAGFDWSDFCESLGGLLGSAFKALIGLGKGLWNSLCWFGEQVIKGGWQGMIDTMKGIGRWIQENILDPFINGIKSAFGIASPAKTMKPIGQYIIEGMLQGIKDTWHVITDFFGTCGRLISNAFDSVSSWWDSIGNNIVTGIWNGICDGWSWVCDSVWDLCSNLWDNVTGFFGINSPSRLARDTMKWLPVGMAAGVEKTADTAIDSVMDLAQSMQDEASVNPVMAVDTAFMDGTEGLENVLGSFADKVVSTFDSMIGSIERLIQQSGFVMPALATGSITPYATGSGRSGSAVQDIIDALTASDNGVTRDDLNAITTRLERAIDSISFYLGDEDIARHAAKGQQKLNRRYSTME